MLNLMIFSLLEVVFVSLQSFSVSLQSLWCICSYSVFLIVMSLCYLLFVLLFVFIFMCLFEVVLHFLSFCFYYSNFESPCSCFVSFCFHLHLLVVVCLFSNFVSMRSGSRSCFVPLCNHFLICSRFAYFCHPFCLSVVVLHVFKQFCLFLVFVSTLSVTVNSYVQA